jgi:hypothetical protein
LPMIHRFDLLKVSRTSYMFHLFLFPLSPPKCSSSFISCSSLDSLSSI